MSKSYSSCLHTFNGCTTPSNEQWQDVVVLNEEAIVPGNTIKEEHWEKDKRYDDVILRLYSKMGHSEYTEHTIEGFYQELENARNGIRRNNLPHLTRVLEKAYQEVYGGVTPNTTSDDRASNDKTISLLLNSEGSLR